MSSVEKNGEGSLGRILKGLGEYPLGFGGASISGEGAGYGFGDISQSDSIDLLNYVYDRGLRIFDSAPIYGFGESEIRLGMAFKKIREKVFLISKSGVSWHSSKRVNMTNDPKETEKMLHESLKRFDTDYIDLYMIHWPDKRVDIRQTMEVLARAKAQGKIKHIGLCNSNSEEFKLASEVESVEVFQSELNVFERNSLEETIPLAVKEDLSFMSWGTLDKGILTGRVHKERSFDKSDCRSWAPWWKSFNKDKRYELMDKINPLLEQWELSPISLALGFNLSHSHVDSLLCGGRSIKQWDGLIEGLKNLPSVEQLSTIEKIIHES
ncbi:hypothetical protein A9Q84_10605 [Halobacteriovorax marinus]|uniref:NADP-dependent oxidoreductase domain-containing protein n=1 Tax=Halobacteriovorax marinus TaxID=97084 RepID=A0A1Y5F7C6_9BACT|nr:hypothetical protein A9Q84_10605 [Halobacteriovorax marinus]